MPFKILSKIILSKNIKKIEVAAPLVARKAAPGQFVVLRINEKGERIPLTIADKDLASGSITLIFQEVGKTTKLLGALGAGQEIVDVVGPLGKPAEIKQFGQVVAIGGGAGTAVLFPEVKALKEAGNFVITILGARCDELLILEDELKSFSDRFFVTTDDGSCGLKGLVTDKLKEILSGEEKVDLVLAIGPVVMMKAVSELTRPYGIKTLVSLNPIMVDGTGMCGACRCSIGGKTKFVCVEGPEFDGHQVDFDELLARERMYLEEERLSNQD
jgi:ferredoxin--NADP+ reductase